MPAYMRLISRRWAEPRIRDIRYRPLPFEESGSARASFIVYRHFVETGTAPSRHTLAEGVGELDTVDHLLSELHERHLLVLDDRPHRRGEIRMALPFAAEPTDFRVTADKGSWWANCAWDALAIPAALQTDGGIESTWSDTAEPLELVVEDGHLDRTDGHISFVLAASQWWDVIVLT